MIIKKLFLRDFGIFENEEVDGLESGLVVIGGLNRSGKTTFLKALRHLGYGFPRDGSIPEARNKHHLEAVLELEKNKEASVILHGFAEPQVSGLDNKSITDIDKIYRDIDFLTYQQLFTITLDELKQVPKGLSGKDGSRLQSVLLGAGLGEIARFPRMEKSFSNKAEKIGGKNGSTHVWAFKPYADKIDNGLELRNQALKEVDEYYTKTGQLYALKNEVESAQRKSIILENKITRLDILKNNYQLNKKRVTLENELNKFDDYTFLNNFDEAAISTAKDLKQRYEKVNSKLQEATSKLKQLINMEEIDSVYNKLIKYKDELLYNRRQLSGLKVRVENYKEKNKDEMEELSEIKEELKQIDNNFSRPGDIIEINTDRITNDNLEELVDDYQVEKEGYDKCDNRLNDLKAQTQEYQERLNELEVRDLPSILKVYFSIALGLSAAGAGLAFINIWFGIFALTGLVGVSFYFIYHYTSRVSIRNQKENIELELNVLKRKLEFEKDEFKKHKIALNEIKRKISDFKNELGIGKEVLPENLKDYFREIKLVKKRILNWKKQKKKNDQNYQKVYSDVEDIYNLLSEFIEVPFVSKNLVNKEDIIENFTELVSLYDQIIKYLDAVIEVGKYRIMKNDIKGEIRSIQIINDSKDISLALNDFINKCKYYKRANEKKDKYLSYKSQILQALKTDRVKKAYQAVTKGNTVDAESLLEVFEHEFNAYTSFDEVERLYQDKKMELKKTKEMLEDKKEKALSLKEQLKELATSEKIEKGQRIIDDGRREMAKLAEDYAVYRAAAFILERVRYNFMEKTIDKLLEGASNYFEEITGGEYKKLIPADKLLTADFQAVMSDGKTHSSTEMLSRATAEQLFLSVRMSRIKEIKPSLPVIIDDGLVNFDYFHLENTLDVFSQLSKTNQVFILTCHPHLVDYYSKNIDHVQFWKLEKGKFTRTGAHSLKKHLDN